MAPGRNVTGDFRQGLQCQRDIAAAAATTPIFASAGASSEGPRGQDQTQRPATLPALLDRAVARFGARPAIDFLGRRWTYRDVGRLVDRLAGGLAGIGVRKGVHVGLCLPNTPYAVLFYFAVLRAGGVVVNYNPLYTARELETQIRDSRTTIMVVMDLEKIYRPLASIAAHAGLQHVVVCPMAGALPLVKSALFRLFRRREVADIPADNLHVRFDELLASPPLGNRAPPADASDLAVLQYTGGTTGVPKGAMLTHGNLTANMWQIVDHAGPGALRDGEERILGILPLFHVFALTVSMNVAFAIGAELVLLPQFRLEEVFATIRRCRPTLLPAVPTVFGAINGAAEKHKVDLTSIRLCISGGAPLPQEVAARFEALTGCRLAEGYGLTECSPVVTVNPLDGRPRRAGSTGIALPGTIIEIRDPDHPEMILPQGEKGEVCVRGPQVMTGYWKRAADTRAVTIDGALRTGDIGYLDADGYLFLVDRIKDLIICSGYNVYPRVIEEALYEHPAVAEAIAIAIPDAYRGESPKAFVTLKPDTSPTPEELREFLTERLSKIEMPVAVEIRASLPKTMVGKLSRKELVAEEKARAEAAGSAGATRLSGH
ncbi:long-chain fatty acid--CoA ligase [Pseudoxanthobacter sp.]|uniref:long-chain-fatty-acid--CoA ligase n=1 Tax=Pseudoxanthobacter sp. TaxID=1925742 RepID=UPI002FE2A6F8